MESLQTVKYIHTSQWTDVNLTYLVSYKFYSLLCVSSMQIMLYSNSHKIVQYWAAKMYQKGWCLYCMLRRDNNGVDSNIGYILWCIQDLVIWRVSQPQHSIAVPAYSIIGCTMVCCFEKNNLRWLIRLYFRKYNALLQELHDLAKQWPWQFPLSLEDKLIWVYIVKLIYVMWTHIIALYSFYACHISA